ncbi:DUF6270 domain-containing protein [Georgenia sp. SUBG003]|uniref:DUF6270 domain-containing protein n=1 Tax=Georgenia sp. SUBG003 TaxID=1497974 RepID=UPI003AB640C9
MTQRVRALLYGSCVSRDAFQHLGGGYELLQYVARQSLISAMSPAAVLPAQPSLVSPFQERMVRDDVASTAPSVLLDRADASTFSFSTRRRASRGGGRAPVSQWYDPERGSAALPGIISRSLHQRGHKVDVVTGVPNYPTGSVYSGYSVRPYRRENIQNVTVHRAPLYPSHDSNPIKRATNYLSFAVAASAVATAALRDVDSVLVHSTPPPLRFPRSR